jgi:hypothetical protein
MFQCVCFRDMLCSVIVLMIVSFCHVSLQMAPSMLEIGRKVSITVLGKLIPY